MTAYFDLARVYDRLMDHLDFSGITDYYLKLAAKHGWPEGKILDLACGTGNISLELKKRGYDVCGVDLSVDMLAVADKKIREAGYMPCLTRQDMRSFCVTQRYAMVLCAFDSLNYIMKEEGLCEVLTRVNEALLPKGLFLFDVHSLYKMKEMIGDNVFTYQSEDLCYIWKNWYLPNEGVCEMQLDIFHTLENGHYERIEEYHKEKYHSQELICRLLKQAGFEFLGVYDGVGLDQPGEKTERLYFVAQKHD